MDAGSAVVRRFYGLVVIGVIALALGTGIARAEPAGFPIGAKAARFAPELGPGAQWGRVRLHGMLELPTVKVGGQRLVDLSDLAWDQDEQLLYAVSNRGALFWLKPRIVGGELVDVRVVAAFALYELDNRRRLKDRRADAEGLDIVNGANGRSGDAELLISFEREPRVVSYRANGSAIAEQRLPAPLGDAAAFRSGNQAFEALAIDPQFGVLVAPEAPLKQERSGFNRIFALDGRSWPYPNAAGSGIVALKSLGQGNVLVLERDHTSFFGRTYIALRRFSLRNGRLETLLELNSADGLRVENFEGLARHHGRHFFMVSDNNSTSFQRTLLLYFELLD